LGALRAVAQTISYEVVLAFIFFVVVLCLNSMKTIDFFFFQGTGRVVSVLFPLMLVFFVSSLAETNRAPFDLAEGESELVSGFNVEYGGLKFALIFLSEYARIVWISCLVSLLFFFHLDRLYVFIAEVMLFISIFL
jgi:NADH:ubiquinone oxidoreductase subunit H